MMTPQMPFNMDPGGAALPPNQFMMPPSHQYYSQQPQTQAHYQQAPQNYQFYPGQNQAIELEQANSNPQSQPRRPKMAGMARQEHQHSKPQDVLQQGIYVRVYECVCKYMCVCDLAIALNSIAVVYTYYD